MKRVSKSQKNRGVKRAPFVVLIGANMPSVLAEISFISNPADELLLKKNDHRNKVVEGLFHGVQAYLKSQGTLSLNNQRAVPSNGR
ncbi:MAG: N-acetylmuramoyl-L-alanine amidase [Acidobacteria bacterium]|nr:N-acetylmuramoyl-L-alanine amidase [Acidobacteriota bacterium]